MKTKHSIIAILVLAGTVLFACKKNAADLPAANTTNNEMASAAHILEAPVLTGAVTQESDNEGIVLDLNQGKTFIILMKLQGSKEISFPDLSSAQVITGQDGVIVKDLRSGKTFLFPNNDTESLKKFESVRSCFKNDNSETVTILGSTVVNS